MEFPDSLERHLRLEGTYNVRDIGGYPASDGRRTRWRRLFRSDSLHGLTPASQRSLLDHGLRTVIDLRRPSETARKPNVLAGAEGVVYRNLPLFDDEAAATVDYPAQTLEELYCRYLDLCQRSFRAVLGTIADAGAGPTLVHCAVGKDRTGLTIALTLGALGVSEETIADDYALSHGLLAPLFDTDRPRVPEDRRERFERMIQSPRETMLHALAYLDERYGGVGGYLETIGLTAGEVEALRASLLE